MGSGKTSAAIQYINAHPQEKFIYITPYLDEAARIRDACPMAGFIEPSNRNPKYNFRKYAHACALIQEGKNIATTHAAFKYYTDETIRSIKEHGYTLFVDESVDIVEQFQFKEADLQLLLDAGYIGKQNGSYALLKDGYDDGALSEMFRMFKSRELVEIRDEDNPYQWVLPPEFFTAFQNVYILTYLFAGQSMCYLFMSQGIQFSYIGVSHDKNGYCFSDTAGEIPDYISSLHMKLHIIEQDRLNAIGGGRCDLSMNWFSRKQEDTEHLKKHIQNLMRNIWRDIPASQKLWGSYKIGFNKLKGKGYTKLFLPFNARATNDYRGCTHLIYAANVFMNVGEKRFYESRGVTVDEDTYALSVMVQWIWRSAIRDGGEITIYIPSKRMRSLLENWIDSVSRGAMQIKAAPDVV